jgi:hypothetical protein
MWGLEITCVNCVGFLLEEDFGYNEGGMLTGKWSAGMERKMM